MSEHSIMRERQEVVDRLGEIGRDDESFTENLIWALFGREDGTDVCSGLTQRIIELVDVPCNQDVVTRLKRILGCPSLVYGEQLYRGLFGHPMEESVTCSDFANRIEELIRNAYEPVL